MRNLLSLIAASALIGATTFVLAGRAMSEERYEGPTYRVVMSDGDFELRAYDPMIVAEVAVPATSASQAASRGFNPLGGYIFGNNTSRTGIDMTAPVTTQARSEQIAMTAPVTTAPSEDDRFTVQFIMPASWTMDTLPNPNDPNVDLREMPARNLATLRYVGDRSEDERALREQALRNWMSDQGLTAIGEPIWAAYHGPQTPAQKRVYEVQLEVQKRDARP